MHTKVAQNTARQRIKSSTAGVSYGCDNDLDSERIGEAQNIKGKFAEKMQEVETEAYQMMEELSIVVSPFLF